MAPSTIQLDPQTAKALAERAAAAGLSIPDYLKMHFVTGNGQDGVDDPDRWLDELTEGMPELPPLPRDFSSKDIYADHD
jgi:hypothetical protein